MESVAHLARDAPSIALWRPPRRCGGLEIVAYFGSAFIKMVMPAVREQGRAAHHLVRDADQLNDYRPNTGCCRLHRRPRAISGGICCRLRMWSLRSRRG
jgi:hypothetical protein